MNKISDRIQEILVKKNMSTRAFEQTIGCSNGVIARCISKGTDISSMWVSKIVDTFIDIEPQWLLTGEGPMLRNDKNQDEDRKNIPVAHRVKQGSSEKGIPLIPISAMAGHFTGDSSIMAYECQQFVVPVFQGADFLIQVCGDSMLPTYRSGDLVACQRISTRDLFFQWGKVYVLETDQGPLIKRLQPGSDADHILIVSDNDSYPSFELHRSHFHAISLVRGVIRVE